MGALAMDTTAFFGSKAFEGDVAILPIPELLQFLHISGKDGGLVVTDDSGRPRAVVTRWISFVAGADESGGWPKNERHRDSLRAHTETVANLQKRCGMAAKKKKNSKDDKKSKDGKKKSKGHVKSKDIRKSKVDKKKASKSDARSNDSKAAKDGKKSKDVKKLNAGKKPAKAEAPKVGKELRKHFSRAVKRWGHDVVIGLLAGVATQLVASKVNRAKAAAAEE